MKKYFIISLLFAGTTATAQFQKTEVPKSVPIGKVKWMGVKFSELSYYVVAADTMYHFYYKNQMYRSLDSWQSLHFKGGYESLAGMYGELKKALGEEKGYETSFKMDETNFFVSTKKTAGRKFISIGIAQPGQVTGLTEITDSQLESLFGKATD